MHYSELETGMANYVIPPVIMARISGAIQAKQDNTGLVVLTYEDKTTESAVLADNIEEIESFFEIVRKVQDKARN